MAQAQTIKLPNKVVDSGWQDDIDYEPYQEEKTYVSPDSVDKTTLSKIKKSSVKLAIGSMIDWNKIKKELRV